MNACIHDMLLTAKKETLLYCCIHNMNGAAGSLLKKPPSICKKNEQPGQTMFYCKNDHIPSESKTLEQLTQVDLTYSDPQKGPRFHVDCDFDQLARWFQSFHRELFL